jgi:ferredoxin
VLDELAGRAILLDVEADSGRTYVLPPPMAGFFEFSMMRLRGDLDQKLLAELFYEYITVEEEFIKALFTNGETQLGRVFVSEPTLPVDGSLVVLDHERASQVVAEAAHIGIGLCYCRHKMEHLGRACDAPMSICMTFNNTADSLIRHGVARRVDAAECLDLLQLARERGLVQFGENVRRRVNFICNCCGCCCEALIAARRFGHLHPVHTTNFIPELPVDACTGCGKCVEACPEGGLRLTPRPERVITPVDSVHRTVVMAIERGGLQHLVFDNRTLASHRAMAAVLGAILRLPPLKQAMASRQLKSRYLEALLALRPA